jgi:hypothetical protein
MVRGSRLTTSMQRNAECELPRLVSSPARAHPRSWTGSCTFQPCTRNVLMGARLHCANMRAIGSPRNGWEPIARNGVVRYCAQWDAQLDYSMDSCTIARNGTRSGTIARNGVVRLSEHCKCVAETVYRRPARTGQTQGLGRKVGVGRRDDAGVEQAARSRVDAPDLLCRPRTSARARTVRPARAGSARAVPETCG